MKDLLKVFIVFLSLFFVDHVEIKAQNTDEPQIFRAGLAAGITATQVDGDNMAGFNKLGFYGAVLSQVRFHRRWSAGFELSYMQKGSASVFNKDFPGSSYRLALQYIDVPLMLTFHDRERSFFSAGVVVGNLFKFREFVNEHEITQNYIENPYRRFDISAMIGGDFVFKEKYGIGVRWAYSIIPVRLVAAAQYWNGYQYNSALTFRGTYFFN